MSYPMIDMNEKPASLGQRLVANLARILFALVIPLITLAVMIGGFRFLRDSNAPKVVIALVAIVWGVGGVALLYAATNWLVEQLPARFTRMIQPYVFVGPAMVILGLYLLVPTLLTFYYSLLDRNSELFVGLRNYLSIFTQRDLLITFRNNILWIVFGATFCVIIGLLVAVLADRSKFERLAKALIFLPMAISFVGAAVIWKFVYEINPQIGLLNAIVTAFGGQPQGWTTMLQPWNNLFLIVIVVWLQTGFAMVTFSAAIKGIPGEILEAARVDGATEVQIFRSIMIPYLMPTIITVTTTIVIFTLKIFDVVLVMTGGQFGTDVIATQFYKQYFTNSNFGIGSAFAIILLIAVIPVMMYNLRQFRESEAF
ncbi:MAG: sugar ABC transporter permease [Anaerolineae bacterium]|jgi:alpha-glucoside transport system permease protein|nr:sugar ABC transporter permease [Anaerolineae bacterium]